MMAATLPTGGCQFRLLDKEFTCGCQRFRIKKRKRNNKGKEIASRTDTQEDDDDDDDEDDGDECRCGHDACFHQDGSPTPTNISQQLPQQQQQLQIQQDPIASSAPRTAAVYNHDVSDRSRLSVSTDVAIVQRSINPALSAMSGSTTERDYSASATPSAAATSMFKPAFLPEHARQSQRPSIESAPASGSRTLTVNDKDISRMANSLNSFIHRLTDEVDARSLNRPQSSASSVTVKGDLLEVKRQLRSLVDLSLNLRNDQISHQDRLETIEALPAVLEDLSEKIELLDDRLDEKQYSFETRIESKIDDRLAPIESFIRAHNAKKRKRRQVRDSEGFDNTSSIQGDRKRRRRSDSEVFNTSTSQPHGITRTTTRSFTTTTSTSTSFASSSPPAKTKRDEVHAFQFQIEQLKNRLLDVEASGAPSAMRPWDIEIVMIPPSPLVQGAWMDTGASVASTQYESSEIGPPATTMARPALPATGSMPRSFPANCKTYKRLFSRGFVRRLHIIGPTAKEVSVAVEACFQDLLDWCASFAVTRGSSRSPGSNASPGSSQRTARSRPRGPSWQPLRKIYKQVPLEYLPESDVSTPALWTVDYLKVNCMMRSRHRKVVYITPILAVATNITWDDIRGLSRFQDRDDIHSGTEKPTLGPENYWDFDYKLDSRSSQPLAGGGSFFSEPFASFGIGDSLGAGTIAKTSSFKSQHPTDLATPPETAPQLRPQRSSKLNNRMLPSTSPPTSTSAPKGRRQTTSPHLGSQKTVSPPRNGSGRPKSIKSAPHDSRHSHPPPSPPSPPMSHPNNALKRALPQTDDRERSPTVVDSPPPCNASNNPLSSNPLSLSGIGGWQLSDPPIAQSSDGLKCEQSAEQGILDLFGSFSSGVDDEADESPEFGGWEDHEGEEEEEEELGPGPVMLPQPLATAAVVNPGLIGAGAGANVDDSGDGGYHSQ